MIYKVSWYNEDGYGWMDSLETVFQADNPLNETEVIKQASEYVIEKDKDIDFSQYNGIEVVDLTKQTVLYMTYNTL